MMLKQSSWENFGQSFYYQWINTLPKIWKLHVILKWKKSHAQLLPECHSVKSDMYRSLSQKNSKNSRKFWRSLRYWNMAKVFFGTSLSPEQWHRNLYSIFTTRQSIKTIASWRNSLEDGTFKSWTTLFTFRTQSLFPTLGFWVTERNSAFIFWRFFEVFFLKNLEKIEVQSNNRWKITHFERGVILCNGDWLPRFESFWSLYPLHQISSSKNSRHKCCNSAPGEHPTVNFLRKFKAPPFVLENERYFARIFSQFANRFLYSTIPSACRILAILSSYMVGNFPDGNVECFQQAVESAYNQSLWKLQFFWERRSLKIFPKHLVTHKV